MRSIRNVHFGSAAVPRWKYPKGLRFVYDALGRLRRKIWVSGYSDKRLLQRMKGLAERNELMNFPDCAVQEACTVEQWLALVNDVRAQVDSETVEPGYTAKVRSSLTLNNEYNALVKPVKVE